MIKQMSAALAWKGVEDRQEARDICRALLKLVRDKVEEDRCGDEFGRG